ncbi:extracellular solute-binding protein [Paenibacillus sp. FSL R10-2734]|uniref:ABC transporter substrate-binding protein n=1 Tax=Paenibacillus sp. FSL R10-2734 TaxID=2954691 RepID=UPI0030D92699
MTKRRRTLSTMLLASTLLLTVISGCSGNNAPANESATPTEKPAATEQAAASNDQTSKEESALEGKVVFWSMYSNTEPMATVYNKAADEFKAANPKVELEIKFVGRDIKKLVKPAIDGGEVVDIFEGDPSVTIPAMKDNVLKIDDLLQQPSIDVSGSTVEQSLIPSLMSWTKSLAVPAGLEEGYYAIPQAPYAVVFFYNKEAFEKAGVTSAPTTWEEFLVACEALKKSGVSPVTFDDAYRNVFIGGYLSSAMGADWVDQLVKDKTGEMWKDPIVKQFANDIVTMREKGYFSSKIAGFKYPAAQQELALGKSAMYLNGTWLPNEVAETAGPDFKWGSFQFPTIANGGDKGGQQNLNFGAQGLLLNKNSKNIPAAFEFVKYLVSKSTQDLMAKDTQSIPATVGSTWPSTLADAETAFNNAKVNIPWAGGIDNGGDFSTGTVIPVFMELVTSKMTADEYVAKMSAAAQK